MRVSEIIERVEIERVIASLVENREDIENYRGKFDILKEENFLKPLIITDQPSTKGECIDYVIITSQELAGEFQHLCDWLTKKGTPSVVKTIEWIDGHYIVSDIQERIRNFIKDAYTNWGTIYFLLGGDICIYNEVPQVQPDHYSDVVYSRGTEGDSHLWKGETIGRYGCGDFIKGENGIASEVNNKGLLAMTKVKVG